MVEGVIIDGREVLWMVKKKRKRNVGERKKKEEIGEREKRTKREKKVFFLCG